MILFWCIFIPVAIVAVSVFLGRNVSREQKDDFWRNYNSNPPSPTKESESFRNRYLHRNDAKHERHRHNQWPL